MGGCFQHETFGTVEELLGYIKKQIEAAKCVGLYLFAGEITQYPSSEGGFRWTAYFSK